MTNMTPGVRKFALTAHITASVGWLGAVAGFLALAVAGFVTQDAQLMRGAYLAMELTCWCVIVPLSFASLLTGVVQSLGTTWGLFRHYWVLAKLVITIPAALVLLLHLQPIGRIAGMAAETTLAGNDLRGLRIQLIANAVAALVVLLAATALSVYKPQGMTRYGKRKQRELFRVSPGSEFDAARDIDEDVGATVGRRLAVDTSPWLRVFGIAIVVLAVLFVILHLVGGGLGHH